MQHKIIYLGVCITTGDVDWSNIADYLTKKPPEEDLVEGWEWRPFQVVPAFCECGVDCIPTPGDDDTCFLCELPIKT